MQEKLKESNQKNFRILWSLVFGVFYVAVSGCYMSGGISNLSGTVPLPSVSPKPLATIGNEFVSGSAQYENTLLRNYKIISSAEVTTVSLSRKLQGDIESILPFKDR